MKKSRPKPGSTEMVPGETTSERMERIIGLSGSLEPEESTPQRPRHRPPPVRRRAVIQICLYPNDVLKLDELTRGRNRMRSAVVRCLLRRSDNLTDFDLDNTLAEDNLIADLTRLVR